MLNTKYLEDSAKSFFSVPDIMKITGVCNMTVYKWIRNGQLIGEKTGEMFVFTKEQVLCLVEKIRNNEIRTIRGVVPKRK